MRPSDLEKFRKRHTSQYPLVSLFNLDDDPQESNNLAEAHPKLVEELLTEAESVVSKAPGQLKSDRSHFDAPVAPYSKHWYPTLMSLGTNFPDDKVIPFKYWLDDDVDITQLNYRTGLEEQKWNIIVMSIKVFGTILIIPIMLIFVIFKLIRKK